MKANIKAWKGKAQEERYAKASRDVEKVKQ